ncbi:hypothetical protein [Streptomyces sp. NPDC046860]|uniref:hypothetical protein n=1 Tax=Streptomyces sp. NPDC046860 TaxID=3154495 RepID=UPI0033C944C2
MLPFEDQWPIADWLWDYGPAHSALLDWELPISLLDGPDGQQLCVMPRPRHARQYLVAPLEPRGFQLHQTSDVLAPNGIAVPDDPARAAAAVARRVLPRYAHALDQVRRNAADNPETSIRAETVEATPPLTLVSYPDGVVGAPEPDVPAEARSVLLAASFLYSPLDNAFVLPATYSSAQRALLLQRVIRSLNDQGIGVTFRHATQAHKLTSPPTAAALPRPTPASRPSRAR